MNDKEIFIELVEAMQELNHLVYDICKVTTGMCHGYCPDSPIGRIETHFETLIDGMILKYHPINPDKIRESVYSDKPIEEIINAMFENEPLV